MGAMVFKSNVPRFKKRPIASELNPNVGPGVYSVGSLLKGKIQVKDTDAAIRVMQLDIKTEKRGICSQLMCPVWKKFRAHLKELQATYPGSRTYKHLSAV